MNVPSRDLDPEDLELIEFARQIVDANTDGGIRSVRITDLMLDSCP